MNQLVVALVVILLPGIIAAVIADKVAVHSKWTSFKFSLYAFVLGVSCYVALQLVCYAWYIISTCSVSGISGAHLNVWSASVADNPEIPAIEVIIAFMFAFPIAVFASVVNNNKLLLKFATRFGISQKFGDENLFSYYLNLQELTWVYVRDVSNNLTYQGIIVSFSETEQMQELVLSDVSVYRYEDSALFYEVPSIYLAKPIGQFIIEALPESLLEKSND